MIRIHTLGGLSVRSVEGAPLPGAAAQPRRMAILALLARAGDRGVTREKLLSLLWPDADDERGPRALTQALYALRKDLGAEEAIAGAKELRLDPALVTSDIAEFASAIARGDDQRAAAAYHGPFLDGFHLPGADPFSRWMEGERDLIAREHSRALESLARAAATRGDPLAAVTWWRKLAALEPLNARVTVGLMEALTAAGDRSGAIQHARVYELLVEQQLDLPPDRDVLALAERLRRAADAPASVAPPAAGSPLPVADSPLPAAGPPLPAARSPFPAPRSPRAVLGILLVVGAVVFLAVRSRTPSLGGATGSEESGTTIAIGQVDAFGADSAARNLAAPVADLLTTGLARAHGVRVISHGRMLELLRRAGPVDSAGFVDAARRAGAGVVIDGTLYVRAGGRLRLDLRRVDLATGAIGDVRTIEGNDLFALVDSGTAQLVAALGADLPAGSVSDVTTRSLAAYRTYENGIRAYYARDTRAALTLFDEALAADSTFALAAYYGALAASTEHPASYLERMERARRLAARATDRERLTILAGWAFLVSSPALRAIAETLATRYPAEVEGHLYSGIALVFEGDFAAGLRRLERVLEMDSLGVPGSAATCGACEALQYRVSAFELSDSFPAAEREARRWLRLQPGSLPAAIALVEVQDNAGHSAQAESTYRSLVKPHVGFDEVVAFETDHFIAARDYSAAEQILETQLREAGPTPKLNALWGLALSRRQQGRLTEALELTRRLPPLSAQVTGPGVSTVPITVLQAQVELELGHGAAAAALFDAIARVRLASATESQVARLETWMLTQEAGARLAAGDSASLGRLADSIRSFGEGSGFGRDRRLYHHVRGLLLAARRNDSGAIAEFRAAMYAPAGGYSRSNYELARVLLRAGRAREAVTVLQQALRGPLQASNLYLNRTEVHELLGAAWAAAGVPDSAAAHYDVVARDWAAGDPPFRARADKARPRALLLRNERTPR